MNIIIFIQLYLLTSVAIVANGKMDRERVTDVNKKEVDFHKECLGAEKPCLVKCCGINEVLHVNNRKINCAKNVWQKNLNFNKTNSYLNQIQDIVGLKIFTADKKNISSKKLNDDFKILYRKDYNNLDSKTIARRGINEAQLTEDGIIHFDNTPTETVTMRPPDFCIELAVGNRSSSFFKQFVYSLNLGNNEDTLARNLYGAYGGLITAFFLLLVLVVYGLLKQLRSSLNGMLLMVFMACLLVEKIFQSSMTFYDNDLYKKSKYHERLAVCPWMSPINYFLILATFFWMNIISFDIWWTFRGTRKVREIHRRGILVKFLIYSLYAWGMPFLITITTVAIDKSKSLPASVLKPSFSLCRLEGSNEEIKLYVYVPMVILIFSNIFMLMMTIYNIWLVKRLRISVDDTKNKKNKYQFIIYLRLSVIMGITWIIELVQVFLINEELKPWLYYCVTAVNNFMGVVIFLMMVCKRTIFVKLCKRLGFKNRWTNRGDKSKASTNTNLSRSKSKNSAKTKTTDDSMVFESMAMSNADPTYVNLLPKTRE